MPISKTPPASPESPLPDKDSLDTWEGLLKPSDAHPATKESILETLSGETESAFCSLLSDLRLSDNLLAHLVPLVAERLLDAIRRTTARETTSLFQWTHVMFNMARHPGAGWVLANPHVFAVAELIRENAQGEARSHAVSKAQGRHPSSRDSCILKYLGTGLLGIEDSPLSDLELMLDAHMFPSYSNMEWARLMLRHPQTRETHWKRAWELYLRGKAALTADEALPFARALAENPEAIQSDWAVQMILTYWHPVYPTVGIASRLWRQIAEAGHWGLMHARLLSSEKAKHNPGMIEGGWCFPLLLLSEDKSLLERLDEKDWRLLLTLIADPEVSEQRWTLQCLAYLWDKRLPANLEEALLLPVLEYASAGVLLDIPEETWDRLHNSTDSRVRQAAIFARGRAEPSGVSLATDAQEGSQTAVTQTGTLAKKTLAKN